MRLHENGVTQLDNQIGKGAFVDMPDNSPEAIKILQGYKPTISTGGILTGSKTEYDLDAYIKKLKAGTATPADDHEFILKYILKQ